MTAWESQSLGRTNRSKNDRLKTLRVLWECQTFRKNQSEQKREAEKAKNAKTRRDKRQKESPEEANSRRSKRTTPSRPAVDSAEEGGILSKNSIKKSKKTALKYLHRTVDPETGMHQSHVCVVYGCFILGTQKLKRLNKNQLKVHVNRLSVDQYMSFHKIKEIPSSLRDHYKVSGFPKMLLSPRSNLEKGEGYSCCESCFTAMKPSHKEKNLQNSPLPMASLLERFLLSNLSMIMETYNKKMLKKTSQGSREPFCRPYVHMDMCSDIQGENTSP